MRPLALDLTPPRRFQNEDYRPGEQAEKPGRSPVHPLRARCSPGFARTSSASQWPVDGSRQRLSNFMGAVIGQRSFDRLSEVLERVRGEAGVETLAGGIADDS